MYCLTHLVTVVIGEQWHNSRAWRYHNHFVTPNFVASLLLITYLFHFVSICNLAWVNATLKEN